MNRSISPHNVLIHHDDTGGADTLVGLACNLVACGGRIVVLAVTCVPPSLPLYGLSSDLDQRARHALRRARGVARRRGREAETCLRHGRDAAKVIVIEAQTVQADAIFMALHPPRFSWLPPRLSRTARTVIRRATCPVILGYFPSAGSDESAAITEAEKFLRHVPKHPAWE